MEPQLRFDKATLKRSVRVAVPRFGVDSLTRHANERDKRKRNPEIENKHASKLSNSSWMRDRKTSGKRGSSDKGLQYQRIHNSREPFKKQRKRDRATETTRARKADERKPPSSPSSPSPTHPLTHTHPHPEKNHPAGKDTNTQKKSGQEAAHPRRPPQRKNEERRLTNIAS